MATPAIVSGFVMNPKFTTPTNINADHNPGPFSSLAIAVPGPVSDANAIVLIWFGAAGSVPATLPSVSGITGGGLTWRRYVGPVRDTATPGNPSGTGGLTGELWWAATAAPLGATTFTISIASPLSWPTNPGSCWVSGATVDYCASLTAPWDTAPGLPATLSGLAPQTITATLTNGDHVTFSDGIGGGGHTACGLGALMSADGELVVIVDVAGGFGFTTGTASSGWNGMVGFPVASPVAGVPDAISYNANRQYIDPTSPPPDIPSGLACGANDSVSAINPVWGAVSGATSYNLIWWPDDGGASTTISGITATSYVVTGLTANTAYDWQVQAVNAAGTSVWSATTTCATQPVLPSEPEGTQIFLEWSDDRGHSFGSPVGAPIGVTGQYRGIAQWQRLGMGRSRVFRLSWSAPVRTVLLGAYLEVDTRAKS